MSFQVCFSSLLKVKVSSTAQINSVGGQSWLLPGTSSIFWPSLVGRNNLGSSLKIVKRVLSGAWAASLGVAGWTCAMT